MAGTTWTQADVDRLQAAYSSGILTVEYDGPPKRLVTYQNMDAVQKALAIASQSVNAAAGVKNHRFAAYRKGFYCD